MKKTVLLLLLVLSVSCSKDDSNDTKAQEQGCYMRVMGIGSGTTASGDKYYNIAYGTSDTDQVGTLIDKKVFDFYTARFNSGNKHWIGEVDHE